MSDNRLQFNGRVAIVTGSGRGLGREYAILLARLGASVVVNSTSASTADPTVQDIIDMGGKAVSFIGSVADRAIADGLVQAAVDAFGRIDIVINNAGYGNPALFEDTSEKSLWDMFHVHVGGSWNVTQAAWPHMKKQKYGRIIMITSALMLGSATTTTYSAAKLALVGLAKSLAIEGKAHGILVNTVATSGYSPGAAKVIQSDQIMEAMKAFMPAEDIAPGVLWLVHEDFQATGQSFSVAGRLMTEIFLAETQGFMGSQDADWGIESIREHWSEITDKTDYTVPTDASVFGPLLFQRLSAGNSELQGDNPQSGFEKK
ncbi:Peroxisomal multifunctional enzyme type 2 [Fusarium austroafricanum]|uniref:Peroxisomal multifunctional enzyme type 2 n=1 Tax=Fusarium austroafricanum TaxID=2364996 RepID=A0A8H4KWI9_9HYPO|nr:Peroxisomal multifunctional enzyme type 2 [Fusarium austroafricanum]